MVFKLSNGRTFFGAFRTKANKMCAAEDPDTDKERVCVGVCERERVSLSRLSVREISGFKVFHASRQAKWLPLSSIQILLPFLKGLYAPNQKK